MSEPLHLFKGGETFAEMPQEIAGGFRACFPRTLVFFVDARVLRTPKDTFGTWEACPDITRANGCHQDPVSTIRMLMLICYLATHPSLCDKTKPPPKDNKRGEQLYMFVDTAEGHKRQVPRTDMYREEVYDAEGRTLGWAVHVTHLDQSLCWDVGVHRFIDENCMRDTSGKEGKYHPPTYAEYLWEVKNIEKYVLELLVGSDPTFLHEDARASLVEPLCMQEDGVLINNCANMASLYERFSYKNWVEHAGHNLHGLRAEQSPIGRVVLEDPEDPLGSPVRVLFPQWQEQDADGNLVMRGGAVRIPPEFQAPEVQLRLQLHEDEYTLRRFRGLCDADIHKIVSKEAIEAKQLRVRSKIEEIQGPTKPDVFDQVSEDHRRMLKGLSKKEAFLKRWSVEFLQRYESLTFEKFNIAPAQRAIYDWIEACKNHSMLSGQKWVAFKGKTNIVDPDLDWVANLMATFALLLEEVCIVAVNHEECINAWVACMSAGNFSKDMNFHTIISGAASIGKSFLQGMLKHLLVEKTYENISLESARSGTSGDNGDHMIILHDEAPAVLFSGQDGDSLIKEILARKEVRAKHLALTDDNRRVNIVTVTRHNSVHIMATNSPFWKMFSAMQARFYRKTLSTYAPVEGRSMAALLRREKDQAHELLQSTHQTFGEAMQFLQAMVFVVNGMIKCEILPEPDLLVCTERFDQISNHLVECGEYTYNSRDFVRLRTFARTMTIIKAIHIAFFTPTIPSWNTERPFAYADFYELQFLLTSDEQIAAFTFTALAEMFLDPHRDEVLVNIARNHCQYPSEDAVFYTSTGTGADPVARTNYNYLYLPGIISAQQPRPLQKIATTIAGNLEGLPYTLAPEAIEDIITSFRGKKMSSAVYTGEDSFLEQNHQVPVLQERSTGLLIARAKVDQILYHQKRDRLQDILDKLNYECSEEGRRLLLGRTLRTQNKFWPQLYDEHVTKCEPETVLVIHTPGFKSKTFLESTAILRGKEVGEEDEERTPKTEVGYDFEDYAFDQFLDNIGVPEEEIQRVRSLYLPSKVRRGPSRAPWAPLQTYPQCIIDNVETDKQKGRTRATGFRESKRVRDT